MFFVFRCVSIESRTFLRVGKNVCESDKNTLFLGETHHSTGPTSKKVLLAMETQRKMENIDDIYFRTGIKCTGFR